MTKVRLLASVLGATLALLPAPARAQAGFTDIKLLTHDAGWAARAGRLYWTTDFGHHWRDITPPGVTLNGLVEIANVFFLDTSRGWALLRGQPDRGYEDWSFSLASTEDAGATWSVTPVELPGWKTWRELGGGGALDFVDPLHGWMNLSLTGSSGVAPGLLYSTHDGGRTWLRGWGARSVSPVQRTPNGRKFQIPTSTGAPMISARMRFLTTKDGWLAGGPGGTSLYVTRDGGNSWTRVAISPPPEIGRSTFTQYRMPVFTDAEHGAVVVTFMGSALGLFTTADGGRSWSPEMVELHASHSELLETVVGSEMLTAALTDHALRLEARGRGGVRRSAAGTIAANEGAAVQLSFGDSERGWVLVSGNGPGTWGRWLYATADGGRTWSEITPGPRPARPPSPPTGSGSDLRPRVPSGLLEPAQSALAPAGKGGGGTGVLHTSAHLGFDACQSPDTGVMGVWWNNGPYYDVGFYLGGLNTICSLSTEYPPPGYTSPTAAQWASAVATYGWGLIPFWVGPQAPCTKGYNSYISTSTSIAQTQGTNEADSAASAASVSGGVALAAGSVIYYDMENYDQANSGCQAVVAAFIGAWVTEIHADGYKAGVYTNSAPAESDWADLAGDEPDDIWVTWYNKRATIWGLDYNLSGGLTDSTWGAGSRAAQYFNYPINAPGGETYANTALDCPANCIDRDIERADVDGGNGTKPLSYQTPVDIDYPGASAGTVAWGVDWAGQVVGYYDVPNPSYPAPPGATIGYGFLDDPVNGYSTLPSCGISTGISGVNDTSSAEYVGGYIDSSDTSHGLYVPPAGGCTTVDVPGGGTQVMGINDDDQVVGWYFDSNQVYHGFIYNADTGGITYPLDYPGAAQTVFEGINGLGQITGTYTDSRGNTYPFIYEPLPYQPQTGTWSSPLSSTACRRQPANNAFGINNNDLVALDCYYFDAVFDYAHSTDITTISYPGSQVSRWPSINGAGLLAGVWADSQGISHGFLATPKVQ